MIKNLYPRLKKRLLRGYHRATLKRLDTGQIPADKREIRLFAVLRNQAIRLPWFLSYYRALGVNRFFIVDNDSTDDTRSLLLKEPDVHLFHTAASFRSSDYGAIWREKLLNRFGLDHWCVAVDVDEMLIYCDYENKPLSELASSLVHEGTLGLEAFWLQMYSDRPVREAVWTAYTDPLILCPYFDMDSLNTGPHPKKFGWTFLQAKAPFFFRCRNGPTVWGGQHHFRWDDGVNRPEQISKARAVVLHFKFTSDLLAKCEEELERRQHYASSDKYGGFYAVMMKDQELSLLNSDSVRYVDSTQLEELRFLRSF